MDKDSGMAGIPDENIQDLLSSASAVKCANCRTAFMVAEADVEFGLLVYFEELSRWKLPHRTAR